MAAVLQNHDKRAREALGLADKIEKLQRELADLVGADKSAKGRARLSPQTWKRIAAALKAFREQSYAPATQPAPKNRPQRGGVAKTSVLSAAKRAAFDPFEAGRQAVAQLRAAEGGAWTGAELETLYALTPANLHKRRAEHRIVCWKDAKNQFFYPKWQFNEAGALLPGVQDVLQTFRSPDEWRVMRYFLGKRSQLADRAPLDFLRAGEVDKVVAHAKLHAEENTW